MKLTKKKRGKRISANRAVLTSFFVDLTDIIANAIVAFITGSIVMLAETVQGIVDALSVGLVYIGLRRSRKAPDKEHPFGYGKALYVWTFMAGVLMFGITAIVIFYMGLQRFLNPEEVEHIYLAFAVLTLFILTNGYSLSVGVRRILRGRKLKDFFKAYRDSSFVETKTTFTLDLIGSSAAVVGLIALILYQITGDIRFDGIGAMAIGLTLAGLTIFLMNNTRKLLIGRRASPETEKKIKEAVNEVRNVKGVLDLKTMNVGLGKVLVNVEIEANKNMKTKQLEKLMDNIKKNVKDKVKEVIHIQVELETPEPEVEMKYKK